MPCKDIHDDDDRNQEQEETSSIVKHLKSNGFSIASLIKDDEKVDSRLLCFAKAKADFLQRMSVNNDISTSIKANNPIYKLEDIECHLETKDLWEKFHELGTEMIITKTGR